MRSLVKPPLRILLHRACAMLVFALLAHLPLAAQAPPESAFGDEAQVTAADLVVGVGRPDLPPPKDLDAADFEILLDGKPLRIVGADVPLVRPGVPVEGEPWTFMIYVDLALSSPFDIAWAADHLAQVTERLAELGRIEIVVADPWPHRILDPTRDTERALSVLADLALRPEGDDELVTLRDELVEELAKQASGGELAGEPTSEPADAPTFTPGELAHLVVAEEERLARRQQDELVRFLADEAGATGTQPGARRAVFLVSSGFDFEPERFYRPRLPEAAAAVDEAGSAIDLAAETELAASTLGAYGWIVVPMARPPQEPPPRGSRIGKWLAEAPSGTTVSPPRDPTRPDQQIHTNVLTFKVKRQAHRDRKKAEAHLELGRSLAARGDLAEAEAELRRAIYNFADDPRLAKGQAEALVALSDVLGRQEEIREARRALKEARALDPGHPVARHAPDGDLLDPMAPLTMLAEATAGALVRDADALDKILTDLAGRVRLTYQIPALTAGELHRLELRCFRRACDPRVATWARVGTPDFVAATRVRRLLGGEFLDGDLRLRATFRPESAEAPRRGVLKVDLELPQRALDSPAPTADLRLSLGYGDPSSTVVLEHQRFGKIDLGETAWSSMDEIIVPEGRRSIAIAVEILDTGQWATAFVDLPAE